MVRKTETATLTGRGGMLAFFLGSHRTFGFSVRMPPSSKMRGGSEDHNTREKKS